MFPSYSAIAGEGVSVSPKISKDVGTDFSVPIKITNVDNFGSGMFVLVFNDTVLKLKDVVPGKIEDKEVSIVSWEDAGNGICIISVKVPDAFGASGTGSLAVAKFESLKSNVATRISVDDGLLEDCAGHWMENSWDDADTYIHKNDMYKYWKYIVVGSSVLLVISGMSLLLEISHMRRKKKNRQLRNAKI
jgi:hypothetical protein